MDSVELPESPALIPNGIELSHLTRLLDRAQPEPAAELRWRFALVEIATDTLQTIYASNKLPHAALWHEEARHRAGHFLRLALADTIKPPPAQVQNNLWNVRAVARLAQLYRSLHRAAWKADSEPIISGLLLGYTAVCRPLLPDIDMRLTMRAVPLDGLRQRALILFIGCILGGVIERALQRGCAGPILLAIHPLGGTAANLQLQTREPIGLLFDTAEYQLATRLAAALKGELVGKKTLWEGSTLALRFPTQPAKHDIVTAPPRQSTGPRANATPKKATASCGFFWRRLARASIRATPRLERDALSRTHSRYFLRSISYRYIESGDSI